MGARVPDLLLATSAAPTVAPMSRCADDREAVAAFHAAALASGRQRHGAPGVRPQYHPGYYSAFVLDRDGKNLEAVHHTFS